MLDLLQDANDFIGFQDELANVQAEIQRDIGQLKKSVRKNKKEVLPALSALRRLLWYSRCLGDALAWQVMIFDRKAIAALMQGTRQPVAQQTTSTKAVFAMAAYFLGRHIGIPIVHDITNWLRIGDVTLLRFDGDNEGSRRLQTVELKSSIGNNYTDEDGVEQTNVMVNVYSNEPIELAADDDRDMKSGPSLDNQASVQSKPAHRREDRRLEKQFRRLEKMIKFRDLKDNAVTTVDGIANINLSLDHETTHHWSKLKQAIRLARKEGYASFDIDNFISYAVFYRKEGVTEEHISRFREAYVDDLEASILAPNAVNNGFILIRQIPMKEEYDIDGFPIIRFFNYEIPKVAVGDLLRNRLIITAAVNFGRLDAALAAEGVTVYGHDSRQRKEGYPFSVDVRWPTGDGFRFQIPSSQVAREVERALYEFNGLDSVVHHITSVRHLPDLIPYEEWKASVEV